jgi:hypothetical protein
LRWANTYSINTWTSTNKKYENLNFKKQKTRLYPFIHNPPHGFSNDVSHLIPVNVPAQRHVNQVFVVFQ